MREYARGLPAGIERVGVEVEALTGNPFVGADVIRIGARIDDEPDRSVGDLPHRGNDLVGHRRRPAVDEDGTFLAQVDDDVSPGADDHVDVGTDL